MAENYALLEDAWISLHRRVYSYIFVRLSFSQHRCTALQVTVDALLHVALVSAGFASMLLAVIAGNGANDGVLLARHAVCGTLYISLGAGGVILALALCVLHAAAVSGAAESEHLADGLLQGALLLVVLAGRLRRRARAVGEHDGLWGGWGP